MQEIDFDGALKNVEELDRLGVIGNDGKIIILILKIAKTLGMSELFVKLCNVAAERAAKKIFI